MDEGRYEAFEIIIKERTDGQSWFDIFVDQVTENCESLEDGGCTCGMESAGGMSGTLDQCYKWTGIDDDKVTVNKVDLMAVLNYLELTQYHNEDSVYEAAARMKKEATSWEDFLASIPDYDEDEEDDGYSVWDQD